MSFFIPILRPRARLQKNIKIGGDVELLQPTRFRKLRCTFPIACGLQRTNQQACRSWYQKKWTCPGKEALLEEKTYSHLVALHGQKQNLSYDRNGSASHNKVERETRWRPSTASTMSPTCRPCRAAKPPAVTEVTWCKRVSRVGTLGVKHLHLQHSRILQ